MVRGEDVDLPHSSKVAIALNAMSIASKFKEARELGKLNTTAGRMADAIEKLVAQRERPGMVPDDDKTSVGFRTPISKKTVG